MASATPAKTQYDSLATAYDLVWSAPAIRPLLPLLTRVLKSSGARLQGAHVLDLACGTGIGLRLLKSHGASRLVGVDISPQMIDIAKSSFGPPGGEGAAAADVTLHVADCSKPLAVTIDDEKDEASFDVVLALWLLNYAPSAAELRGMWDNVARYLKPEGKFVGIIENHDVVLPRSVGTPGNKYGVVMSDVQDLANGEGWKLHVMFDTTPVVEFDAFRMYRDVFEREAKGAGFGKIEYHAPGWEDVRECIGQGIGGKDEEWWRELVEQPPNYVIVTEKV